MNGSTDHLVKMIHGDHRVDEDWNYPDEFPDVVDTNPAFPGRSGCLTFHSDITDGFSDFSCNCPEMVEWKLTHSPIIQAIAEAAATAQASGIIP